MKARCNKCKKELSKITHFMPNLRGEYKDGAFRPPLCKECWEIVYKELKGN